MDKKIEVKCECPKSSVDSITSMTEAFSVLSPARFPKRLRKKKTNTKATARLRMTQTPSLNEQFRATFLGRPPNGTSYAGLRPVLDLIPCYDPQCLNSRSPN